MSEYLDLALEYLREHKWVAGALGILFIILLIKNFWFLVKLLVVLALGAVIVVLIIHFVGGAMNKKKELLKEPKDSSCLELVRPQMADLLHPIGLPDGFPLPAHTRSPSKRTVIV